MPRLLLVEGDESTGWILKAGLCACGHQVVRASAGRGAVREASVGPIDLVLLDLGLPDLGSLAVCRDIRAHQPAAVVIILAEQGAERDVIVGLEAGADDYVIKPVSLGELSARIRAHLRRAAAVPRPRPPESAPLGDLVIDTVHRRVTVAGIDIPMRAKEFELLARLAAQPGIAVSRETLMVDVWHQRWSGSTKTLDVHLVALRRRLADAPRGAVLPAIVTVRGHGYRLQLPPST
jgi:DNA-binding response OmpR family regulator